MYHNDDYSTAPVVDFVPFAPEFLHCACTGFCDMDGDGSFNPLDVSYIVAYVYKSQDFRAPLYNCTRDNGDWDCNGDVSPLDVAYYVNKVYKSYTTGPCDPCAE